MRSLSDAKHGWEIPVDFGHAREEHINSTAEQEQALEGAGPGNRCQSTVDGVRARDQCQEPHCGEAVYVPHFLERKAARVKHQREIDQHVAADVQAGVQSPRLWAEAAL